MKKILAFFLLLVCFCGVLASCGDREGEGGIVGVWCSEELSAQQNLSQKLIYAFAPNGHMLSIDLYEGEITSVVGAHYAYDEKGILSISQYGKDDGKMNAVLSGDTLELSIYYEDGVTPDEEYGNKKIIFHREKDAKEGVLLGNWLYAYMDETNKVIQIQYAFTKDGNAARALYEGSDLTDGILKDYVAQKYTLQTVNGEELLYIFTENADGTQADLEVFRVGFPYDGYMTMEPLVETEGATEVLPFRAISEETK